MLRIASLHRYPVKSMLGESIDRASVDALGLARDRALAVVDGEGGRIASAKHPARWQALLQCRARVDGADGGVRIALPDGSAFASDAPDAAEALGRFLGQPVRILAATQGSAAPWQLERSRPDEVAAHGTSASVAADTSTIGRGAPPGRFFDYAPLHLVTTASLRRLAAPAGPGGVPEVERYRPNLVVDTGDADGFVEDAWVGRELAIGRDLRLRVVICTPRCAVPMLRHGAVPERRAAYAALVAGHRVVLEGYGTLPCLGVYAQVLRGGEIGVGDAVRVLDPQ